MMYDFLRWYLARPVLRLALRPTVTGLDRLPPTGALILAGNHIAAGDSWPIPILVRRRIVQPAKLDFYKAKNIKGRLLARFLQWSGQVPIDTRGGKGAQASLQALVDVLSVGDIVGIFPEGTRSPDGRLYRFHTGVARLALSTGAPVYPLGCVDTRLKHGFLGLPTLRDAHYTIGAPLDFSRYNGRQGEKAVLRYVTDEIAAAVQAITGQTYVDVYARRVKSGELTLEQTAAYVREHPGGGPAPAVGAVDEDG